VVISAAHPDRTKHGVDGLFPVGNELRQMAGPAACPAAAIAGIQPQQVFQQPAAEPGHRGADRPFHRFQAAVAGPAQRTHRHGGQPCYLGGRFRRERGGEPGAEPPFSPSGAEGASAAAVAGLASQIFSLTSTIWSLSAANSA
jgi:hypothetical protein